MTDQTESSGSLRELARFPLIDLTTFRRTGDAVVTPVRFAVDERRVVVSLRADSGKVKRAARNPNVVIAGHPGGPSHPVVIRFLEGEDARRAQDVLRRRHPFLFLQRLLLGRRPGLHVVAELTHRPAAP
jgi:PPOX class probable F420-dependent enzyme